MIVRHAIRSIAVGTETPRRIFNLVVEEGRTDVELKFGKLVIAVPWEEVLRQVDTILKTK